MTTKASERTTLKKTLSQLTVYNLQLLIEAQKRKMREKRLKGLELFLEKNKLIKLEQELEKRNVKKRL